MYVLNAITSQSGGSLEELSDETQRICDVQPYFSLFRVAEKQVSDDNNLNKNITSLIGKTLTEFKTLKNPEVNDFRYKMNLLGEEIASKRSTMTLKEKIMYQYPPKLAKNADIPHTVRGRLRAENFWIVAKLPNEDVTFTFDVACTITPMQLLEIILSKKKSKLNLRERSKDYILKIGGQEEYIFGDNPLIQFLYIQDTLSRDAVPAVVVMMLNDVYVFTSPYTPEDDKVSLKSNGKPSKQASTLTLRKRGKHVSSWDIADNFQCKIQVNYL